MKRIEKKAWSPWFQEVLDGAKTYDLRIRDFEIEEGDILVLKEWDPKTKQYTGREVEKRVGYVGTWREGDLDQWWPREDVERKGLQAISLQEITERSSSFPPCFHRVTIKGLCVRDGKVLLVKESPELSGKWELPGGGLDFGEDIRLGFEREVKEEMGLVVTKMSKSPVYVWPHKYTNRRKLDWFYSFVVAYRIELKDLDFTPTKECEAIQFFSQEELKSMELCGQTNELRDIFDPGDFKDPFLV